MRNWFHYTQVPLYPDINRGGALLRSTFLPKPPKRTEPPYKIAGGEGEGVMQTPKFPRIRIKLTWSKHEKWVVARQQPAGSCDNDLPRKLKREWWATVWASSKAAKLQLYDTTFKNTCPCSYSSEHCWYPTENHYTEKKLHERNVNIQCGKAIMSLHTYTNSNDPRCRVLTPNTQCAANVCSSHRWPKR